MRRWSLPALVVATLVAAGGCDLGSDGEDGGGTGDGRSGPARAQLVERLRRGGHAVVFRHAATEPGMDTTSDLTDCSRQRNLNGLAIFDATGLNPEEGDAVITAPRRGGRGYAVVSTVGAGEWPRLARGRD